MYVAVGSATGLAALGCAVAFLLRRHCALLDVSGSSMVPTYRDGDRLLALKIPARLVRRGAVVAIRMRLAEGADGKDVTPGEPLPTAMIKRVAALPGDRMPGPPSSTDLVPARHVYVLGDNHEASYDSRHTGPVPFDRLAAVVLGRIRHGVGPGITDHHVL
ncbi:S26 family signal peptidase [Streptomyces viridosporus]|uniref:S26 family signal peptidase n=1 Tax=Streptomyces viridosporus TaxID=67581 RepID=UPI0009BF9EC7|nr:S26 family signal peptidase [Streptomyces viridosporus]